MLSKGSVAVLPLLLLGLALWRRRLTTRDLIRSVPFFAIAAVLVRVNMWFQTHGDAAPIRRAGPVERLLGAAAALWFYLYKALLPFDLAFVYPRWTIRGDEFVWWLPLIAVLWRYRNSWGRPLLFTWSYFGVALLPVLGFTDVGFMKHSLVADHYQHLALIGVVALAAAAWDTRRARGESQAMVAWAAATLLVLGLSVLTSQQNRLYAKGLSLYRDTLAKNPTSSLVHNNLGTALSRAHRINEAIDH